MTIEILMPALSPTMTEGTLAKWLKNEGDKIAPGDVIAEIETDKATMEVESIEEGILGKILIPAGTDNVAVNSPIAVILEEGEDMSVLANYQPTCEKAPVFNAAKTEVSTSTAYSSTSSVYVASNGDRIFASPLAKRIATQENINLNTVLGSGPHGRIIKADVLEAKANPSSKAAHSSHHHASFAPAIGVTRHMEEYRVEPLSNMRKVIAKRLVESKQTVPHFYLSIECNIDKLLTVRSELNKEFEEASGGNKLSVNDFVIKASALALKHVPEANSSWSDEGIKYFNNVDISVAVAIEGGLVTPIIRNADTKSLAIISLEMKELAKRAREGKLKPEEYQGGGFSISNLGMFNIKQFNAIINPPQSCIIAVGAGIKKPIVAHDQIVIGNMVEITLSCDHRVVDGAVGAKFLSSLKKYIEHPIRMLV